MDPRAKPKLQAIVLMVLLIVGTTLILALGFLPIARFWTDFGTMAFLLTVPLLLLVAVVRLRNRRISASLVSAVLLSTLLFGILTQVATGVSPPDRYYLHDTATSGISPAGEYMNRTQGTGGFDAGTGADGSVTSSASSNINTDVLGSARSTDADGIVTIVTSFGSATGGTTLTVTSATGFAANDEIFLINLQGDGTNNGNVGNYEFLEIQSITSNTFTLQTDIQNLYGATGSNLDLTGQSVIVQRVPQWTTVTINSGGSLTANAWDGSSGGVIVFRATGAVNVNTGGAISADGLGYQGGTGGTTGGGTNGESYDGTVGSGGDDVTSGGGGGNPGTSGGGGSSNYDGTSPNGTRGGGGGGGNTDGNSASDGAAGGGGGGYAGGGGGGGGGADGGQSGGSGGSGGSTGTDGGGGGTGGDDGDANLGVGFDGGAAGSAGSGGNGGAVGSGSFTGEGGGTYPGGGGFGGVGGGGGGGGGLYGDAALTDLFLGSGGGGGGGHDNGPVTGATGGDGGGIVFIVGDSVTISGTASSNGTAGAAAGTARAGSSGGGAGGSIMIQSNSASVGTSLVTATGGSGGATASPGGGGGSGGVGRVRIESDSISGTASPAASTAGTPITGGAAMTFDTLGQTAYWYLDETWPTGSDDFGLAAGNYTFSMYFSELPVPWWNESYQYQRNITVTAGSAGIPSNYSVNITFDHFDLATTQGKSQTDGDDARIAYWTGSTWNELDRVLDIHSSWNDVSTKIWFKTQAAISASGSDSNYRLYYGNTTAANPPANADNVYAFWDGFESGNLNKWSVILDSVWSAATDQAYSGTYALKHGPVTSTNTWINAIGVGESDVWLESRWRLSTVSGSDVSQALRTSSGTPINNYETNLEGTSGWNIAEFVNDAWQELSPNAGSPQANVWTNITTIIVGQNMKVFQDGTQIAPSSGWFDVGTNHSSGSVGFLGWTVPSGQAWWIDDVIARKYVDPEPTTSLDAEMSSPSSVEITVHVHHTAPDGTDPQEIVTSSATTIDGATDPLILNVGTGAEQVFQASDPRRLRLEINVTSIAGGGSFTLAYNSTASPTNLETPVAGTRPILVNPTLSPTSGTPTTNFNFTIDYRHPDGLAADVVRVNVSDAANGTYNNFTMTPTQTPELDYFVSEYWATNGTVTNFANMQADQGNSAILEQSGSSGGSQTILEANATADTTTTSGSYVLMDSMSLTPGAGDYLAIFSTSVRTSSPGFVRISLFVNGVQQAHTEREQYQESSIAPAAYPIATHANITVGAGETVEVRWLVTAGTGTANQRTLNLVPVDSTDVSQATATGDDTTASTTYTLLGSMTITPGPGDYLLLFSTSGDGPSGTRPAFAVFVNGAILQHTERTIDQESSIPNTEMPVFIAAKVSAGPGEAVEIRWAVQAGTGTIVAHERTLTLFRTAAANIFEASATSDASATNTADALLSGMTLTPGAGTYLALFSESHRYGTFSVNLDTYYSYYVNGVQTSHTERLSTHDESIDNADIAAMTNGVVSPDAGQAVEVRWRGSTTDSRTSHERTFVLLKVSTGGISLDNVSSGTSTTSPLSFSHTIGSGTNRLLVVHAAVEGPPANASVTDVTYNSVSLTRAVAHNVGTGTDQNVELWYMLDADLPATGSYTVSITTAGGISEINGGAVSVTGAAQAAPEANASNDDGGAGDEWIETQITTVTDGSWIFDVVGTGTGSNTFTANSGQTERYELSATTSSSVGGTTAVPTAGTQTINWTVDNPVTTRIAHALAAFAPAATGAELLIQFNTTGIRSGGQDTLRIEYNLTSADDTFLVWVWDFTASDWFNRGTLDQTAVSFFNYTLTADEKSGGEVRIQIDDTSTLGSTNLAIAYQLVNNTLWTTGVTYYVNTTLAAGEYSHFFWANDTNGVSNRTATLAGPSVNALPTFSDFRLENATAASRVGEQIDVDVGHFFLFNITDDDGWSDIGDDGNVSLRLWYDGDVQTPTQRDPTACEAVGSNWTGCQDAFSSNNVYAYANDSGPSFPQIVGSQLSNRSSSQNDDVVNLPTPVESGDLVLVFHYAEGSGTRTFPSPWVEIKDAAGAGGETIGIAYLIATGGETSVTVTKSVSERFAAIAIRISAASWHGTTPPEVSTGNTGTSTSPDPDSVTASWGSENNLFIASFVVDAPDVAFPITGWPAIYDDNQIESDAVFSAAGGGIASRELAASSDDPGAFTIGSETWWAGTIVVRPAAGGGGDPGKNDTAWKDFGFALGADPITSVEVGVEWFRNNTAPSLNVSVSWDGGSTWATNETATNKSADDNTVEFLDFTSATAWTATKLNNANLWVRVGTNESGARLDYVTVRVVTGSELTYAEQTTGANYRIEIKYLDTADPSTASLSEWSVTEGSATYNASASSQTEIYSGPTLIGYEFSLSLTLGFQVRQAGDPVNSTTGSYNDLDSWNGELEASDGTHESTLQTASTGEHMEFGVYMYTNVTIGGDWSVTGFRGQTVNSNTITVTYRSNDDFNLTIWFTTHLVKGGDTIDISNVQILAAGDPGDNITSDTAFAGLGEANLVYILGSASWYFPHAVDANENTTVVQFSVFIPLGQAFGTYTAQLVVRIQQRPSG